MKGSLLVLLLSAAATSNAPAKDSKSLQDFTEVCQEFFIQDPNPVIPRRIPA
jgi:hypothetical protein